MRYIDPSQVFVDERLQGICIHCGGYADTRDHVPSRAFLDDPLPSQMAVVSACHKCNESYSLDEQFVACLVECAASRSSSIWDLRRDKVKRILTQTPALFANLEVSGQYGFDGTLHWDLQSERVVRVMAKLARSHLAYDLHGYPHGAPIKIDILELPSANREVVNQFEVVPSRPSWPEIGSRAFVDAIRTPHRWWNDWVIVQAGQYRYRVDIPDFGAEVRVVISEFLACTVLWDLGSQ